MITVIPIVGEDIPETQASTRWLVRIFPCLAKSNAEHSRNVEHVTRKQQERRECSATHFVPISRGPDLGTPFPQCYAGSSNVLEPGHLFLRLSFELLDPLPHLVKRRL
jgi:hypothetical protein